MKSKMFARLKCASLAGAFAALQFVFPAQMAFASTPVAANPKAQDSAFQSAELPGQGDQTVWCQFSSGWVAHLGGNNTNRYPLTQLPAGHSLKVYLYDGQVWATDRSDPALKAQLNTYCASQYTVAIPQVTITPVCGVDNDSIMWTASDLYTVTYTPWTNGSATVTAALTTNGYVFTDGTYSATYTITENDRSTCPPEEIATPAAPQSYDPCGVANIHWVAGSYADTNTYTWSLNTDGSLTVAINDTAEYVFVGGNTEITYPLRADNGERCIVERPQAPVSTDPCGYNNIRWDTQSYSDSDTYSWTMSGNTLTVSLTDPVNDVFDNGETSISYTLEADSNERCQACTVSSGHYVAPGEYGPYEGSGANYEFRNDGLRLTTPGVDGYVYGLFDAGTTRLADLTVMGYDTLRLPTATGNDQTVAAYVLYVDKDGEETTNDGTYLFYEPIYNGNVTTGTWQTWDVYNNGNSVWWGDGNSNPDRTLQYFLTQYPNATVLYYGFNQGSSNTGADTVIQSVTFDCATTTFGAPVQPPIDEPSEPEQPKPSIPVLGAVTDTPRQVPVLSAAIELPAELPQTGSDREAQPLMILLASLLAYAVMYIAQPRREYEL